MKAIWIEKIDGKLKPQSREILIETVQELIDGWHKVTVESKKRGYTASRYKFYFGYVVPVILMTCAERFKIVVGSGEMRRPQTPEEMHEILKYYYNPVTVITPKGAFQSGSTTTALNDSSFIGTYLESIMSDFSEPPYNCTFDFFTWQEWADHMKETMQK